MSDGAGPVRLILIMMAMSGLLAGAAFAQPPEADAESGPDADVVIVRAERSGPQLWRVRHPDHDGEAYVFATIAWLPDDLDWNARPVESVMEDARLVLTDFEVDSGAVGASRMLAMMLRTMVFNRGRLMMPRGQTLADKVGPELAESYREAMASVNARRGQRRAARRSGGAPDAEALLEVEDEEIARQLADLDDERLHPFFQAMRLIGRAADSAGLSEADDIGTAVRRTARRNRVRMSAVQRYSLAVSDVGAVLRQARDFSEETNRACIDAAVRFATHSLPSTWFAAQAWARGDVEALRAAELTPPNQECQHAMERELGGLRTLEGQYSYDIDYAGIWSQALMDEIAAGGVVLAVISVRGWLDDDRGVRARLIEAGYEVLGP